MLQLKLTRALGRGIAGANPSDVKNVQTRLHAIKQVGQPLYKGKIDGKDGKKTEEAICLFQQKERLPITGYIKPGDKTAQKLRDRTPMSTKFDIATTQIAVTPSTKLEVQQSLSSHSADKPLPPDEKRTLDMILKRMQDAHGLPLCFEKVELLQCGHLQALLAPAKSAVRTLSGQTKTQAEAVMVAKLNEEAKRVSLWISDGKTLSLKSKRGWAFLKKGAKPSSGFLKGLTLSSQNMHEVYMSTLAYMESRIQELSPTRYDSTLKFLKMITPNTSNHILKKVEPFVKNARSNPVIRTSGKLSNPELVRMMTSVAKQHFSYDLSDPNFHAYSHITYLCREEKSGSCTPEVAFKLLKKFPAPQIDGFQGVKDGGRSDLTIGTVSHKVIDTELAIINYTVSGEHMLDPGSVLRMVIRHKGIIYIGTYGEGVANMRSLYGKVGHHVGLTFEQMLDLERPFLAWFNEDMAEQVWGGVDRAIVAGLASMR